MKDRVVIDCNDENNTLKLSLPNNIKGTVIGPYFAMYKYLNEGYTWTNWLDWYDKDIGLENVQDGTCKFISESYVNSIIIGPEVDENLLLDIIAEMGYMPNYILSMEEGRIELKNVKHMDYECGKGMYFYDNKNLGEDKRPDLIYEGQYLRCLLDKQNNIKSGHINIKDQEILIPFHIKSLV